MKSHEALKRAIGTLVAEFARRLCRAPSTIYKWTEPSEDPTDSGSRNPVDVVEQIIEISLAMGKPIEDAYAPLHYFDMRFGRACVDVVPSDKSIPELGSELCKTMKEVGELVQKASGAFLDHKFTKLERAEVMKEGSEALRQLAVFVQAVRKYRAGNHGRGG